MSGIRKEFTMSTYEWYKSLIQYIFFITNISRIAVTMSLKRVEILENILKKFHHPVEKLLIEKFPKSYRVW